MARLPTPIPLPIPRSAPNNFPPPQLAQGGYRACNRLGIEACTSPVLKISFETAASFLVSATLHGDVDALTSPAARIILGRPVGVGTGAIELVQDMAARPEQLAC